MENTRRIKRAEIGCYLGYVTQAISLNLLPLFFVIFKNDFGLTTAQLSLTVFLTFFVQLAVDLLVAYWGDKTNLLSLALTAHAFCAAGLIALSFLPMIMDAFIGILICVLLYSVGSGLLEVVINPIFDRIPKKDGLGFSFAHSFYCWGQMAVILITALLLAISEEKWQFIPLMWACVPVFNLFLFFFSEIPDKPKPSDREETKREKKLGKGFLLFIILLICAGAAEQGIAQWASYFAEKGLGISKLVGDLIGPCLFAFFMAISRTLVGICGKKLNTLYALCICALFSALCYLVIAFVPSAPVSLAACAISGFAVSIMWPSSLDLASSAFVCSTTAFSLLSLAGDIGCVLGPTVNGLVSDYFEDAPLTVKFAEVIGVSTEQAAIRLGFALTSLFSVLMFFTLLRISKTIFKKSRSLSKDGK